ADACAELHVEVHLELDAARLARQPMDLAPRGGHPDRVTGHRGGEPGTRAAERGRRPCGTVVTVLLRRRIGRWLRLRAAEERAAGQTEHEREHAEEAGSANHPSPRGADVGA